MPLALSGSSCSQPCRGVLTLIEQAWQTSMMSCLPLALLVAKHGVSRLQQQRSTSCLGLRASVHPHNRNIEQGGSRRVPVGL